MRAGCRYLGAMPDGAELGALVPATSVPSQSNGKYLGVMTHSAETYYLGATQIIFKKSGFENLY